MELVPDIEKAIAKYLRDTTSARVVAHPPGDEDRDTSWVMYTLISSPREARSSVDRVIHFRVQFDCYAGAEGGLPEARGLMAEVRGAMCDMPLEDHEEVVVTYVRPQGGQRLMDTAMEPARDRYTFDTVVTAHGK